MNATPAKVTIIIPVHNEGAGIAELHRALGDVLAGLDGYDFRMLMVDDGSADDSWKRIESLAKADPRVRGISLSRNFGKEMALTAGVEHAGDVDAVICMDADLQHPPEVIPRMLEAWREGFQVVATIRRTVADYSMVKRVGSKLFYAIMSRYSDLDIPPNSTDFRLLDRQVVETLRTFKERARLFRGLIDWMGFKKTYIEFHAPCREQGRPAYSFQKLFNLAVNSFTSFSLLPLRFTGYLGVFITASALVLLAYMAFSMAFLGEIYTAMAFFMVFNTFLIGLLLCAVGMVALYIGHIHTQVVERPLYIIGHATDDAQPTDDQ